MGTGPCTHASFIWRHVSGVICCILVTIGALVEGSAPVDYAPGDTRLLDYTIFCQALTVEYTKAPTNIGTSVLYALNSKPQLTDMDSFAFNRRETLNASHMYYEWNLHFYRGSSIEVLGVIEGNGSVEHYFIQGKEGYNAWKVNPRSNSSVVNNVRIDSSPAEEVYNIGVEDQYFVIFRLLEPDTVTINVTIAFNRTQYAVSNEDQIDRRYFNTSTSASIATPINQGQHILLVYGNSSEPPDSWNTIALDIDKTCEPRVWLYAVIPAGSVAIALCLVVTFCCVCCICRAKRRSPEGNPLLRDWDVDTEPHSYYRYSDRSQKLDPLTEMAINNTGVTNPHIATFGDDIKPPSFQDNDIVGSPKFTTFKP